MKSFKLSALVASLILIAVASEDIKDNPSLNSVKQEEGKNLSNALTDLFNDINGETRCMVLGQETSASQDGKYECRSYFRGASVLPPSKPKGISYELMIVLYAVCSIVGIFTVCFLKFAFELLVSIDDVKEDKNRQFMMIHNELPENLEDPYHC